MRSVKPLFALVVLMAILAASTGFFCTEDSRGAEQVRLTAQQYYRFTPQWTPDGEYIALSPSAIIRSDGSGEWMRHTARESLRTGRRDRGAGAASREWLWYTATVGGASDISPDGSRIVYNAPSEDRTAYNIVTSALDGSDRRMLTNYSRAANYSRAVSVSPVWSPDGAHIAFGIARRSIYTMNSDGSELRDVMGEIPLVSSLKPAPVWSPDGENLAFFVVEYVPASEEGVRPSNRVVLYSVRADGTVPRRLFVGDSVNSTSTVFWSTSDPAWSPDGKTLAFGYYVQDNVDLELISSSLYTVRDDGSDLSEIAQYAFDQLEWSPDGTRILATGVAVYVVNSDGSDLREIGIGGYYVYASWSPDGSRIAARITYDLDGSRGKPNDIVLYTMAPDGTDIRVLAILGENNRVEAASFLHLPVPTAVMQ